MQDLVNQQYEGEVEELEMGMLETTSKLGRKQLIHSACRFLLESDGHFMIYAIFFDDPHTFGGVNYDHGIQRAGEDVGSRLIDFFMSVFVVAGLRLCQAFFNDRRIT